MDRRTLLLTLGSVIAAPAIVRASSLMPVRSFMDMESFVPLKDFEYDGFNYVNAAGETFCGNPEGLFWLTIWRGQVVEEHYRAVTAFYHLGSSPPKRIGILSDADHIQYGRNLQASIDASRNT